MAKIPRATVFASALLLAACSSTPQEHERNDAGIDAQSMDAHAADANAFDASDRDSARADAATPEVPDPACATHGCVRAAFHVGDYSRETLQPFLEAGVEIDNGYSVWTIEYVTRETTSLATVAIPYPLATPSGGYHIVANAHGTVGLDDACSLTGTVYGSGLAGLFGARGTIGVATDYPGLGTSGVHPYLVSDVEGSSALDSIRAAALLSASLGVATSGRSAVVGVSQGGHATLAAAALHSSYAPELEIRAFGAAAPASVWLEHWQGGLAIDGDHLVYHALLAYAWSDYYAYDGPTLWTDAFGANVNSIMTNDCIFDFGGTRGTYAELIPSSPSEIFSDEYLSAFASGFEASDYAVFAAGFAANRIAPYEQTAPLAIWQGDADSVVLREGTDAVVAALRAGGVDVTYNVVPLAEHTEVAFGFVAQNQLRTEESTTWILDRLNE